MELYDKLNQQLSAWPEWQGHQRIVLAISGGVDSMVMMDLLFKLNDALPAEERKEYIIAHFNHKLRPDSDQDQALIEARLRDYEGMVFYGQWDNRPERVSEALAREARYRFLADVLHASESDVLMTAHHLNDLGETMLMRLMRGTSLKGLSGMRSNYQRLMTTQEDHPLVIRILRPLIQCTKAELLAYAEAEGVVYYQDSTNLTDDYLRNRVRHQMMPIFEQENPKFLMNLWALSCQLDASYDTHFARYLKVEPEFLTMLKSGEWLIYLPRLRDFSQEQLDMIILMIFEERLIYQIPNYHKSILMAMKKLITDDHSPNKSLPLGNGWVAQRNYDYIHIQPEGWVRNESGEKAMFWVETVGQWHTLDERQRVGIFTVDQAEAHITAESAELDYIPITQDQLPIKLRRRQSGDRLTLVQGNGRVFHKKVSRVLIDQKVAKHERNQTWIVESATGAILGMLPHWMKSSYPLPTTTDPILYILYDKS